MNHIPSNTDRTDWAREALAEFISRSSPGGESDAVPQDDLKCAIVDLICDLMHFADQEQLDAKKIVQLATDHFEAELQESLPP